MKKDTLVGILLIGVILLGFSWYSNRQFDKQKEAKRVQDSIATARAMEFAKANAVNLADSLNNNQQNTQANQQQQYNYTYKNSFLEESYNTPEELFTLSNDKIEILFTTKGAQPKSVLIKNYYTYDSLALYLMKENASKLGVQLYSTQNINTADFTFCLAERTDSTIAMRLYFDENSYVEHNYKLTPESYMVDFNFKLVGMNDIIPRNFTQFNMAWDLTIPRLERGYDNEKNYSTVDYKYPNETKVETLGLRKSDGKQTIPTKIEWFAFQQQFFSAIMVSQNGFSSGELSYKFLGDNDPQKNLMACHSAMQFEYNPEGEEVTVPMKFYFGPNHFKTLKSYDYHFEKIVPLGKSIIGWISRFVIIPIFDLFDGFIKSYGIIILLMTILIKLVISPLTIKSYMSSAKMRVLKPEIEKINAKYPKQDDAMKKQQETMDLYKRSGVSMFGGCLPSLLQFPILFAMFRFFPASFELRQQSFLWAKDLSAFDSILDLPFKIPLYGDHISLFAILMAVSMFFYSKMTSDQMDSNPQMKSMKFMTVYFMPIFMLIVCNNLSSGLSYYYMLSNLFTMLQTWIIRKYFVDEEKLFAKLKENSAKAAKKPKSKFQMRLEAAQKAQQEALRQQQKRK